MKSAVYMSRMSTYYLPRIVAGLLSLSQLVLLLLTASSPCQVTDARSLRSALLLQGAFDSAMHDGGSLPTAQRRHSPLIYDDDVENILRYDDAADDEQLNDAMMEDDEQSTSGSVTRRRITDSSPYLRLSKRKDVGSRSQIDVTSAEDAQHNSDASTRNHEKSTVEETGNLEHIECPLSSAGGQQLQQQLFPCVTPNSDGLYVCIGDHALCDHVRHCPNGEDEDATVCMFHRMTLNYFKIVMSAVFGLTKTAV